MRFTRHRLACAAASMLVATIATPGIASAATVTAANVPYATVDAIDGRRVTLLLDVYTSARSAGRPAIITVHGGGWACGSRKSTVAQARYLADAGFVVYAVDYRLASAKGYANCTGPLAATGNIALAARDVATAVGWVRHNGHLPRYGAADTRRLGMLGVSAGAHLAMMTSASLPATQLGPQAVVSLSGPTNLTVQSGATVQSRRTWNVMLDNAFACSSEGCPSRSDFSPALRAWRGMAPTLLIQATRDTFIDHSQATGYASTMAALGNDVTLRSFNSICHGCWALPAVPPAVVGFLRAKLA